MYYVYILKSINHWRFYVGLTTDVQKRVREHNNGYTKSTKGYKPSGLFFFEAFETRIEARKKEKYYKSGIGKEIIKQKWPNSSAG